MQARVAGRVKWFISIKACMNTMMVSTGWKKKQKFKVTLKQGEKHADRTQGLTQALSNFKLHQIHDALSEVRCMLAVCWASCGHRWLVVSCLLQWGGFGASGVQLGTHI